MTDQRFTTVCDDLEELLAVVDLDDLNDLDTLIMVLLGRPVAVAEGWDDERSLDALDVRVLGGDLSAGVLEPFPMCVLDLARSSAELARDIGPYVTDSKPPVEGNYVRSLDDRDLIDALQKALGQVRLFNMLEND